MKNIREKEILEMIDHIEKGCLDDESCATKDCSSCACAKLFADAGYRKQSEVVKEVLLKVKTDLLPRAYEETGHTLTYYLYELAKQYGVEL